MPVVIGIDSSTQSTKAEARDLESGELLASGKSLHPPTSSPVSEQDPDAWWAALVDAVTQLGRVRDATVAISVAGQQHGLVLLDGDDEPVRPAKLWNDTTSAEIATELVVRYGADWWAHRSGSVPVASFTTTKLAWVARHEPDNFDRVARVMLPHDYLTWRLSGEHVTDRGDASGTGWFDPDAGTWAADLLAAVVDEEADAWIDRLPLVLGPTEGAGRIVSDAADVLGLPSEVVVGPGTGDNMAAALGLRLRPGDIAMSLGTSGTVYAVATHRVADPTGAVAGFADAAGGFLPLVCTLNATGVTDTVARWLGTDPSGLSELALAAHPAPDLVLVPYFDGERTPNLPEATGRWSGLRRSTTREQLARAAHDGVVCGLLAGLDRLAGAGVALGGRLHLVGGGARSQAYVRRCADLHGRPVLVPSADEAVAAGAAVQAAATYSGRAIGSVAENWQLGAGTLVEPADLDAVAIRAAYAEATTPP